MLAYGEKKKRTKLKVLPHLHSTCLWLFSILNWRLDLIPAYTGGRISFYLTCMFWGYGRKKPIQTEGKHANLSVWLGIVFQLSLGAAFGFENTRADLAGSQYTNRSYQWKPVSFLGDSVEAPFGVVPLVKIWRSTGVPLLTLTDSR